MINTQQHSYLRDLIEFGLNPSDWTSKSKPDTTRLDGIQTIEFTHRDDADIRLIGAVTGKTTGHARQILYLELQMNTEN